MGKYVILSCSESDHTLLFGDITAASHHVGNSIPRLDADIRCAAHLPQKQMLRIGKFHADSMSAPAPSEGGATAWHIAENKGVLGKIIFLER